MDKKYMLLFGVGREQWRKMIITLKSNCLE
jgi:hypothetical protein